jgi:CII-binding regulator of phage lambda lysogenization HflD
LSIQIYERDFGRVSGDTSKQLKEIEGLKKEANSKKFYYGEHVKELEIELIRMNKQLRENEELAYLYEKQISMLKKELSNLIGDF